MDHYIENAALRPPPHSATRAEKPRQRAISPSAASATQLMPSKDGARIVAGAGVGEAPCLEGILYPCGSTSGGRRSPVRPDLPAGGQAGGSSGDCGQPVVCDAWRGTLNWGVRRRARTTKARPPPLSPSTNTAKKIHSSGLPPDEPDPDEPDDEPELDVPALAYCVPVAAGVVVALAVALAVAWGEPPPLPPPSPLPGIGGLVKEKFVLVER